jgi:hypothetical protein
LCTPVHSPSPLPSLSPPTSQESKTTIYCPSSLAPLLLVPCSLLFSTLSCRVGQIKSHPTHTKGKRHYLNGYRCFYFLSDFEKVNEHIRASECGECEVLLRQSALFRDNLLNLELPFQCSQQYLNRKIKGTTNLPPQSFLRGMATTTTTTTKKRSSFASCLACRAQHCACDEVRSVQTYMIVL